MYTNIGINYFSPQLSSNVTYIFHLTNKSSPPFLTRKHSILFISRSKVRHVPSYPYQRDSPWNIFSFFERYIASLSRLDIPRVTRALFWKSGRYLGERDITMRVHSVGDCRCWEKSRERRRDGGEATEGGSEIRHDGKLKKTTRDETRHVASFNHDRIHRSSLLFYQILRL